MECPTVKIKSDNEDGYVVINESDFDPSKHERHDETMHPIQSDAETQATLEADAPVPAHKRGRK